MTYRGRNRPLFVFLTPFRALILTFYPAYFFNLLLSAKLQYNMGRERPSQKLNAEGGLCYSFIAN